MLIIEQYIQNLPAELRDKIGKFHNHHVQLIQVAKGSNSKHQAWVGGYRDHIEQCLHIADRLYGQFDFDSYFNWADVFLVLYFHDIEKLWKYSYHLEIDKFIYYRKTLSKQYDITLSHEQLHALEYIHGEGDSYYENRVMNELGAFCHSCDIMSARIFHGVKDIL